MASLEDFLRIDRIRRISLHYLRSETLISLPLRASHEHLQMVPFILV